MEVVVTFARIARQILEVLVLGLLMGVAGGLLGTYFFMVLLWLLH